jgi:hypothetical protein
MTRSSSFLVYSWFLSSSPDLVSPPSTPESPTVLLSCVSKCSRINYHVKLHKWYYLCFDHSHPLTAGILYYLHGNSCVSCLHGFSSSWLRILVFRFCRRQFPLLRSPGSFCSQIAILDYSTKWLVSLLLFPIKSLTSQGH